MAARLRIALVAPPFVAVPPPAYGGTERVVAALAEELHARGHAVTLFASGDSSVSCRLVATVPRAAWSAGGGDSAAIEATISAVDREGESFDVVHSHLGLDGIEPLDRLDLERPALVHTFHLPVDRPEDRRAMRGARGALVAISASQARLAPDVSWAAVIPNGLPLADLPFGAQPTAGLCFVGRIDPVKGVVDAIEVARLAGRRLRVAGRVDGRHERVAYFAEVVRPALAKAGAEFVGELDEAARNELMASSVATVVTPRWPEPFGLVTIESLACGTPVLAYPAGALPEIVRDGVDGFLRESPGELASLLPDVARLDRAAIRRDALERFSAARMADGYERLYERLVVGDGKAAATGSPRRARR